MSLEITPAEVDIVPPHECPPLPEWKLYVMAAACGTSAANIYYNSPLLESFSRYFHCTESQAGLIAMASQVGYGIGLLLFVPLGDLLERRQVVLTLTYLCMILLAATAFSPNLATLIILQGLVGITAMSAQLLIPLAVDLTPEHRRGHTVGTLLAGLLCGLLMARVVGGIVGDKFGGWQAVFVMGTGLMLLTGISLQIALPHRPPSLSMSYGRLMGSLVHLVRDHPVLRRTSAISGLSFAAFMIFWTALSFLMREVFHRGATEAGLFGVVGLAGALAAPIAGKLSDRRGPRFTITVAMLSTIASFLLMAGWVRIAGLVVGVLLMDLGVQSVQVAAQSRVMALVPEARSRVNTVYMVARFIGGALGSAIGATAYARGGWTATCGAAVAALTLALIVHLTEPGSDRS
jgi:predicted MFS family arabinose efflux permease